MIRQILFLLLTSPLCAQLAFQPNQSAVDLVDQLLHSSVVVNGNPYLSCYIDGTGTFYNGYDHSFSIDSAIVLSTGDASFIGRNYSYNASFPTYYMDAVPELVNMTSSSITDVCFLSFNIVPTKDSIILDYAFGSEEYIHKVNQVEHDVFGIFISGQNPKGGVYNDLNIATLHNSNEPINVQTINHIQQDHLYTNNYPQGQLVGQANPNFVLDGFTKPLRAGVSVMAGGLYNIKIAIADVGDPFDDSFLFFKKGAFRALSNVSALPIELSDIQIDKIDEGIQINWYTSYENNNVGFTVLRSSDAIHWEEIGFHPGRGVTKEITGYAHLDSSPLDGPNYYRLEQIDKDYNSLFSNVSYAYWDLFSVGFIEKWFVYGRHLNVVLNHQTDRDVFIDIFDALGQPIQSFLLTNDANQIDLQSLPAGIYHSQIRFENQVFVKKIMLR